MELGSSLPFEKALMTAIKDMVFIISVENDSVFSYAFMNQAVYERTNLTEAAIGKTFREVHDDASADLLNRNYEKVIASQEVVVYSDSYTSSINNLYYSESTLTPFYDNAGNCTHIIAVVKDTTAERLAKMESQESWKKMQIDRSRYQLQYTNDTKAVPSFELAGNILIDNTKVELLTDFPVEKIGGLKLSKFINEVDPDVLTGHYQHALTNVFQDVRTRFREKSSHLIGVSIQFAPIEEEGEIVGIYAVLGDMRETDSLITQYAESENRFRIIADNTHDVIILMDYKGEILYVSPSTKQVYGFEPEEYMEKPAFYNVHPEDLAHVRTIYQQAVKEVKNYVIEIRMQHKTNGWLRTELQGTPIFNEQGQFIHMLTITRDITPQKEHEKKLHHYAYHDSLTGLPNRRFFKQRLAEEIASKHEQGETLAVILLDIDRFKEINDQLGHEVGDAVIEEFSRRLSQPLTDRDIATRLGGDEFVLLLPSIKTREQAVHFAQDIQHAMEAPWFIENGPSKVSASMGVALIPLAGATVSSVLKSADLAMYKAKEAGRGTFRFNSL